MPNAPKALAMLFLAAWFFLAIKNQALNTAQKKAISNVELNDICSSYFGTLMFAHDRERNVGGTVNDCVIPRDTKLPCSVTKNYQVMFDGQKEIDALMEKMSNTYELPPFDMIG